VAGERATPAPAYAHCQALLRERDPDRYYASLFAPAEKRPHLFALYAFSTEVARVRDAVSNPMPGEIRLQWWRDAIEGNARGDALANPVAAALDDTVTRFRLPRAALLDLIDARVFDLYDDPMPSTGDLEGYLGETSSALIRLASLILADGEDPGGAEAAGHAGLAFGITGLLRALPWHARHGQVYMPKDILERHGVTREDIVLGRGGPGFRAALGEMRDLARAHRARLHDLRGTVAKPVAPAFLPVALQSGYLAEMQRPGYDPFATVIGRPGWRKLITLWRAARRGF
jgi:phytoene synthase